MRPTLLVVVLFATVAVGAVALVAAADSTVPRASLSAPPRSNDSSGPRGPAEPYAPTGSRPASSTRKGHPRPIHWRRSRSIGLPHAGRLVAGVQLPPTGRHFFTWDADLRRSPNRGWRRYGSDRLVRVLLRVTAAYAAAHPDAPRVGVGDLSRPRGGDFGRRHTRLAHVSHQNGLDVDIYYPRRDRTERAVASPGQIDRALAQDLVDRFVAAGAQFVFVGGRTGLTGPARIVQQWPRHDDHFHVRIRPSDGT